jgi:beta-glucanase (GH16 family)
MTSYLRISMILVLAFLLASCESEPYDPDVHDVPPGDELVEYTLVWEDQFDGQAGESPDPANWTYDVGNGDNGWGNAQLEFDTARPENVSLDGSGNLQITAREESFNGFDYTSARIKTQGLFSQQYGRFEARIKLPIGQGLWPAFWLLGNGIDTVGWPQCGEIDIMEYRGQEPDQANGALHGPGHSAGAALSSSYTLSGGGFHEDFHVFAVNWTPASITWEVDGFTYMTITPEDLPGDAEWVFDDDAFFIILNVAVGGTYVGPPDQTTEFPQTTLVDYVKVYEAD